MSIQERARIRTLAFILIGLSATALSFLYYFLWKCPSEILYYLILTVDFLLFLRSAYLSAEASPWTNTKFKMLIFTVLDMLLFIFIFEVIAFAAVLKFRTSLLSVKFVIDSLRIALFLGPSYSLTFPLMRFACEVLS